MEETEEMCYFVHKMMVQWKSNADTGLKEAKKCFALFVNDGSMETKC